MDTEIKNTVRAADTEAQYDEKAKELHIVIYGGWSNLISVIYYAVAIIVLMK